MRALKKISGFGLLLAILAFAAGCNADTAMEPTKVEGDRSGTCYLVGGQAYCNNN